MTCSSSYLMFFEVGVSCRMLSSTVSYLYVSSRKSDSRFSQAKYPGPLQGPEINSIQNSCPPTARVCLYCVVPYTDQDINKLESVQRRAARWVTRDYRYTSSVSAMLQDLNLDQRRIDSRLVLLYKVTYDLVAIPASD